MEGRKAFMRRTKDAMLWLSMRMMIGFSFKRDQTKTESTYRTVTKNLGDKEDIDVEFMRDEEVLKLDGLSTRSALSRSNSST